VAINPVTALFLSQRIREEHHVPTSPAQTWLESVADSATALDLVPFLQSEDAAVRVRAMTLLGQLRPPLDDAPE
jgi:hypothetical protein